MILGSLVALPASAQAGVGAAATPTFPVSVTVGQTLPASLQLVNVNTAPNLADTNVVCNFGDALPCPAGDTGITLIPSCGSLGVAASCTGADPGVFGMPATATGEVGTQCANIVFFITLIDPIFGQFRFTPEPAPGTQVNLVGVGATCRIDFNFTALRAPTIDQDPGTPGLQTVQVVDNTQRLSGTAATAFGRGTSFPAITVNRATPTIATTASPDVTVGPGQLTDTIIVSNRVNPQPGATVDFKLFAPGDDTCTGTPVFQSPTIAYPVAGGVVTSGAFTPTSAGLYHWIADYNGDANNLPVAGVCSDANENVRVNRSTPTIATTASPNVESGAGVLTDTVIVSNRVNPQPGATVDFNLFGPGDDTCTGTPVFQSLAVPYPVAGGVVTSVAFTPTAAGTYHWIADYNGDANNVPITGACSDANENVIVSAPGTPPPPPTPPTPTPTPPTPTPTPVAVTVPPKAAVLGSVAPTKCTPPPGPAPAGGKLCAAGVAGINGPTGCQNTQFHVDVGGGQITKVVFTLDGKKIKTLTKPNRGRLFGVSVNPRKMRRGAHRVAARVSFSKRSGAKAKTLRIVFQRCAKAAVAPRFTG